MTKRLPLISVVICVYNGADVLPDCLHALQKQNYKGKIEIIIVDDGSTDDTVKIAKSFKAKVIQNKSNLGPAGARNVGIKASKGKIVAFTDDDCRPAAGWIRELQAAYTNDGVVGVGGASMPTENNKLLFRYLALANPLAPLELNILETRTTMQRLGGYIKGALGLSKSNAKRGIRKHAVYSMASANLSFRKDALEAVGGFDESFTFSGEDQDLCRRINQKFPNGLWYAPKAKVSHQYESSLRDTLRRSRAYGAGNARFRKKHAEVKAVVFPFPLIIIASLALGFITPWLLFAPLILVQLLYTRWFLTAVKMRNAEPLLYGYIQFLQEWYGNIGFIQGEWQARKASKIEAAKVQKLSAKTKTKTTKKAAAGNKSGKSFTLHKPQLFGIIAAILLIFNAFEIIQNPLQVVVAALVSFFIPGLLLLTALGISARGLRGTLYAIAGSIGLLMLTTLGLNTLILLYPHVFHFSTWWFVGSLDIMCAALFGLAWKQTSETAKLTIQMASLAKAAPLGYLLILPFMGVLASGILNHSGNNALSMITLALIAVISGIILVRIKKVQPALIPFFLYICGLTIVWMGAMRGDFVSGTDISKEFYLFNLAQTVGHWSPSLYHDPYNACLSINLLPILLKNILKVSDQFVFRAIMPMFYALLPVMGFALCRKYAKRTVAFLAGLFFIMQPIFMSWSAVPIRQMIGFVFFGALALAIFDKALSIWQQRSLILSFGLCMVLAHYSTTYIAIICFVFAYVLQRGDSLLQRWRLRWSAGAFQPTIGLPLIIILIGIASLWYGPVNHTSRNITHLIGNEISNIRQGQIFSGDGHSQQTGLLDQFNLHSEPRTPSQVWQSYLEKTDKKYDGVVVHPLQNETTAAAIKPTAPPHLPEKVTHHLVMLSALAGQGMSKLMRLFMAIGLITGAIAIFKRKHGDDTSFHIFAGASALVIILIIIVPYASVDYDLGRTSQQLLLFLALPTILGGVTTIQWLGRGKLSRFRSKQLMGALVIVYFLFVSGIVGQLTGGGNPVGLLNNVGTQYDQYVHDGEVAAAQWLHQNKNGANIYAGYFGGNRLWLAGIDKPSFYNDILPWTIDKNSYVFSSYAETNSGNATTYYQGSFVEYSYPTQLLNARKDLLYNNGQAKIYK